MAAVGADALAGPIAHSLSRSFAARQSRLRRHLPTAFPQLVREMPHSHCGQFRRGSVRTGEATNINGLDDFSGSAGEKTHSPWRASPGAFASLLSTACPQRRQQFPGIAGNRLRRLASEKSMHRRAGTPPQVIEQKTNSYRQTAERLGCSPWHTVFPQESQGPLHSSCGRTRKAPESPCSPCSVWCSGFSSGAVRDTRERAARPSTKSLAHSLCTGCPPFCPVTRARPMPGAQAVAMTSRISCASASTRALSLSQEHMKRAPPAPMKV